MPAMPSPTLGDFLATYVEGYLLEDVRRLVDVRPATGMTTGACGYPLVMTVCSGVELLGALCSDKKLIFRGKKKEPEFAQNNFVRYWRKHMYPQVPHLRRVGRGIYALVRNGLAHSFLKKGPVVVVKGGQGGDAITAIPGRRRQVIVDASQLGVDFIASYEAMRAAIAPAAERAMEWRLGELWNEYMEAAWGTPSSKAGQQGRPSNMRYFRELKRPTALVVDAVAAATGSEAPAIAPTGPGASQPAPSQPSPPQQAGSGQGVVYAPQQPGSPLGPIQTIYKTS